MGLIKQFKADAAREHARRSLDEGHTILLYRQNVPATAAGWSGPVGGVAEVVEAIEAVGWRLVDTAFDWAQSKNGAVLLLFRPSTARPMVSGDASGQPLRSPRP